MVHKPIAVLFGKSGTIGKARRNQSFQSDCQAADRDVDFSKANEKSGIYLSALYPSSRQKSLERYPRGQANSNCANAFEIATKRELEFIVFGKNTKEMSLVLPAFLFEV
jgi:hypothetical protein